MAMERWRGRVAVVTGASSGIGEAIALELVVAGMRVVGLARREHLLKAVRAKLPEHLRLRFYPHKCDLTDESAIKSAFKWVDKNLGGVDVLINNAGIMRTTTLTHPDNTVAVREMLDTNVLAVILCTREAFSIMRKHDVNDGHIIVMNSVCGHITPHIGREEISQNVYPATKHALISLIETYRQEFYFLHSTRIRITSISPGAVDTDIYPEELRKVVKDSMPLLTPEDVASAVMYAISVPEHVQIHEIILKPLGELF